MSNFKRGIAIRQKGQLRAQRAGTRREAAPFTAAQERSASPVAASDTRDLPYLRVLMSVLNALGFAGSKRVVFVLEHDLAGDLHFALYPEQHASTAEEAQAPRMSVHRTFWMRPLMADVLAEMEVGREVGPTDRVILIIDQTAEGAYRSSVCRYAFSGVAGLVDAPLSAARAAGLVKVQTTG